MISNNNSSSSNSIAAQRSFDIAMCDGPQKKPVNVDVVTTLIDHSVIVLPVVVAPQTNVAKLPRDTYTMYNPNINFFDDYQPFTKEPTSQRIRIKSESDNNNESSNVAAAREVETVHNYSKVLSNGKEEADEDEVFEDEDLGNSNDMEAEVSSGDGAEATKRGGDGDKTTPEHHARRPMNAFLIFCKRHRAIVREKYPNLENRSITKILGDWWANLDNDEKTCYTDLAKQYKDAFFSANPNFRWYKLPAPPLRTLTTRPGNADRPSYLNDTCDSVFRIDDNHYADETTVKRKARPANVGIFKLADEAQMGGLSSLMVSYNSKPKSSTNNNVGEEEADSPSLLKQLGETQSFFGNDLPAASVPQPLPTNAKRKHSDDQYQAVWLGSAVEFEPFVGGRLQLPVRQDYDEDGGGKKSARACKGKRYQEFMQTGKINTCVKKTKSNANGFYKSEQLSPNGIKTEYDSLDHMYASPPAKLARYDDVAKMMGGFGATDAANLKRFDASDFDLEDKIRALPALSMDKYLSRKRDTKKKKKINVKRPTSAATGNHYNQTVNAAAASACVRSPQTIQEAKERIKNAMVGSQKRKARKESITRRDIQQDSVAVVDSADVMALVAEDVGGNGVTDGTSDLLFLATLAAASLGNTEN